MGEKDQKEVKERKRGREGYTCFTRASHQFDIEATQGAHTGLQERNVSHQKTHHCLHFMRLAQRQVTCRLVLLYSVVRKRTRGRRGKGEGRGEGGKRKSKENRARERRC